MNVSKGLTLVEVVVALALMGSVLVASILAFAKHRRQLALADKRIEATVLAESLIEQLSGQRGGFPVRSRGPISGKPGWFWTTRPIGTTNVATLPLDVIRFQVLESGNAGPVLLSVDLVKSGGP